MLETGDQVEILASEAQHPQPSWLRFVATGKARAGVRRFVRHKEREETIELGRKIYDEIIARLPAELDKDALKRALKKLKIENVDELMIATARKRVSDEALMEALMPGSAGGDVAPRPLGQRTAISIKGLTPGVAYHLALCCHPIPGDRIVGIVATGKGVTIHARECQTLETFAATPERFIDVEWNETPPGDKGTKDKHTGRISVIAANEPGALANMTNAIAKQDGAISNLKVINRQQDFFEALVDVDVRDVRHLASVIAGLRGASSVTQVERARS
jgi:(p)ppGpp synthase/HD superfamily hydrolase